MSQDNEAGSGAIAAQDEDASFSTMTRAGSKKRPRSAAQSPQPKKKQKQKQDKATKKPAAKSFKHKQDKATKKPAAWADFSEELDTTSITKQQRHVFDKALRSETLPEEIRAKYEKTRNDKKPGYPKVPSLLSTWLIT